MIWYGYGGGGFCVRWWFLCREVFGLWCLCLVIWLILLECDVFFKDEVMYVCLFGMWWMV